ncbi:hypothetical protein CRUP_004542 [Coryphaenoides rupestris]|nr:hypothetical protein CRUP_004542 [Coryphaenoides rupestris]
MQVGQALGEAMVEEEELAVRKELAEQEVDAVDLQQHLEPRRPGHVEVLQRVAGQAPQGALGQQQVLVGPAHQRERQALHRQPGGATLPRERIPGPQTQDPAVRVLEGRRLVRGPGAGPAHRRRPARRLPGQSDRAQNLPGDNMVVVVVTPSLLGAQLGVLRVLVLVLLQVFVGSEPPGEQDPAVPGVQAAHRTHSVDQEAVDHGSTTYSTSTTSTTTSFSTTTTSYLHHLLLHHQPNPHPSSLQCLQGIR